MISRASYLAALLCLPLTLDAQATTANVEGPLPSDPAMGLVDARYVGTLTVERVRMRRRGPWVLTTAIGGGLGSFGYTVDQSRGAESPVDVHSWVPSLTAGADIALRVPATRRVLEVEPIDFLIGWRSTALLGVRRVDDIVPSSGPIPTSRGVTQVHQFTIGVRFGLLSDWFR